MHQMLPSASTAPAPAPWDLPLSRPLLAALAAIALLVLVVPVLVVALAPRPVPIGLRLATAPARVVPKAELPPVDPVKIAELTPEDARTINAAVPFSKLPNPAARAFRITGAAEDQARAVDCLAAAVVYEAGDDAVGERAVAQVVLNRLRHPAFPKSVCGVVFQGSERSTGCQFTFTCDGAMLRYQPSAAAWQRAREIARLALTGSVFRPVGHATHYHTNWVVPYWSASLEKITAVDTHLFFRWAGWWGTPPAFNRGYLGAEARIPLMARLSEAHRTGEEGAALDAGLLLEPGAKGPAVPPLASDPNVFLVTLDKRMTPDAFVELALNSCDKRDYCKFMAWADPRQTPRALPLSEAQSDSMSFSYLRDKGQLFAKALWNCEQYRRPSPIQCMRHTLIARGAQALKPSIDPAARPVLLPGARPVLIPPLIQPKAPAPAPTPSPTPTPAR